MTPYYRINMIFFVISKYYRLRTLQKNNSFKFSLLQEVTHKFWYPLKHDIRLLSLVVLSSRHITTLQLDETRLQTYIFNFFILEFQIFSACKKTI